MENILKVLFMGGITVSAFLAGTVYGAYKTNKDYQDELKPLIKNLLNEEK